MKILDKINKLYDEIEENYNRVIVIDDYDNEKYTTFYLNKNESFDKFSDLWEQFKEENRDEDEAYSMAYSDLIDEFKEKTEKIDFFECDYIDVNTNSEYELYI